MKRNGAAAAMMIPANPVAVSCSPEDFCSLGRSSRPIVGMASRLPGPDNCFLSTFPPKKKTPFGNNNKLPNKLPSGSKSFLVKQEMQPNPPSIDQLTDFGDFNIEQQKSDSPHRWVQNTFHLAPQEAFALRT